MATITPANLSYKDKDGDLGEVKSLTDTDVTLLNNALQDIEDLKLAYSPGFVKRDLSNLTDTGKIAIAHNSVPSYIYDELTLGASGTSYTPPTDGYVSLTMRSTATGQYCMINNGGFLFPTFSAPQASTDMRLFVPVQKGTNFTISYNCPTKSSTLLFVYLNGTKHEKA